MVLTLLYVIANVFRKFTGDEGNWAEVTHTFIIKSTRSLEQKKAFIEDLDGTSIKDMKLTSLKVEPMESLLGESYNSIHMVLTVSPNVEEIDFHLMYSAGLTNFILGTFNLKKEESGYEVSCYRSKMSEDEIYSDNTSNVSLNNGNIPELIEELSSDNVDKELIGDIFELIEESTSINNKIETPNNLSDSVEELFNDNTELTENLKETVKESLSDTNRNLSEMPSVSDEMESSSVVKDDKDSLLNPINNVELADFDKKPNDQSSNSSNVLENNDLGNPSSFICVEHPKTNNDNEYLYGTLEEDTTDSEDYLDNFILNGNNEEDEMQFDFTHFDDKKIKPSETEKSSLNDQKITIKDEFLNERHLEDDLVDYVDLNALFEEINPNSKNEITGDELGHPKQSRKSKEILNIENSPLLTAKHIDKEELGDSMDEEWDYFQLIHKDNCMLNAPKPPLFSHNRVNKIELNANGDDSKPSKKDLDIILDCPGFPFIFIFGIILPSCFVVSLILNKFNF